MFVFQKIFVLFLYFNLILTITIFETKKSQKDDSLKVIKTFEELDEVMSNSEWKKVWEKTKPKLLNEEKASEINKEFEEFKRKNLKEQANYFDNLDEINLGASFTAKDDENICLPSVNETSRILNTEYGIENNNPKEEVRFIVGKCHPVLLVPGIYSTRLQVRVNCKGLIQDDYEIFKNIRFYCGSKVCENENAEYTEYDLFISGFGSVFQLLKIDGQNQFSACLGYFLTFYNTKNECAKDDDAKDDKYVCNYSKHIKIGYYGSTEKTKTEGECGLFAIQNAVMTKMELVDILVNKEALLLFKPIIEKLYKMGYSTGFSLAGLPNDYRRFVSTNGFSTNVFRYHIENLYKNTGKKVVIVAHSYGTLLVLSNLVKLEKDKPELLKMIKKFVAVCPPFAGSSQLIEYFFTEISMMKKSFEYFGIKFEIDLDDFGKNMMINTLPMAIELRPQSIVSKIFKDEKYKELSDALRERMNLEKKCANQQCSEETIKQSSEKFDGLFKGYFPSLLDKDCQYEPKIKDIKERKCIANIYDVENCPIVIEAKKGQESAYPDFGKIDNMDEYCNKNDENYYYQKECDGNDNKRCVDEIFYKKGSYPFNVEEKIQYFIDAWNENYADEFKEKKDKSYYISKEKFLEQTKKQIKHLEEISLIKDLPIPAVDTDIVYINYDGTNTVFLFKEDFSNYITKYQGNGDGTVPNWSYLIPGFKWIYDMKKNNLPQKIRLIEYCSRLGKNSQYSFDPSKEQNFVALSCRCIDENNSYNGEGGCNHSQAHSDPVFLEYLSTILNDPNEKNAKNEDREKAIKNFDSNISYETKCDEVLRRLLDSE